MHRRQFLARAAGFAAACPVCLSLSAAARAEIGAGGGDAPGDGPAHWSYEGDTGAEHWGELSSEFRSCDIGVQQSPIDLRGSIGAEMSPIEIAYRRMPLTVAHNGHTIQVNTPSGSGMMLNGQAFDLLQFHFHHPSEHKVDGAHHDMELHLVHASGATLGVLGVFIKAGRANDALQPIWDAMPGEPGEVSPAGVEINPADLLPAERRYFRYYGSLTTPPCSERVVWSVFTKPIEASTQQIDKFAAMFPMNARPVQPLHRRHLLDALLGIGDGA